jgi:hypothetical protein
MEGFDIIIESMRRTWKISLISPTRSCEEVKEVEASKWSLKKAMNSGIEARQKAEVMIGNRGARSQEVE